MKKFVITLSLFTAFAVLLLNRSGFSVIESYIMRFHDVKAQASSVLREKGKPADFYSAEKAVDGKIETAWCKANDKKDDEQILEFKFKPVLTDSIYILNGYGADNELYKANNRIKKYEATVTFSDGTSMTKSGELADNRCLYGVSDDPEKKYKCRWSNDPDFDESPEKLFDFGMDNVRCITGLKIKIISVYPGKKYKDTCIAEVGPYWDGSWMMGIPDYKKIKKACCGTENDE